MILCVVTVAIYFSRVTDIVSYIFAIVYIDYHSFEISSFSRSFDQYIVTIELNRDVSGIGMIMPLYRILYNESDIQ